MPYSRASTKGGYGWPMTGEQAIKPIETYYQSYRFRSRLEARWAVFFDALGIKWEYELEGYEKRCCENPDHFDKEEPCNCPVIRYLPDFYLPQTETWVEVKGSSAQLKERSDDLNTFLDFGSPLPGFTNSGETKYRWMCNGLLLLGPIPYVKWGYVYHPIIRHYKGLMWDWVKFDIRPCVVSDGEMHLVSALTDQETYVEWSVDSIVVETKLAQPVVVKAYQKARSARFEHGEHP